MWKELLATMEVTRDVPNGYRRVFVDDFSLYDALETKYSFVFPRSFKEFLRVFGTGFLADYFNFYGPNHGLEEQIHWRDMRKKALMKIFRQAEMLPRIVIFCDTLGGDLIAWDPEDVTDKKAGEFGIYALPRNDNQIVRLADTFHDFILDVCLGPGFNRVIGKWEGGPKEFEPRVEKIK